MKTMSGQKRKEQRYDVMKSNSPAIKNDLEFSVCWNRFPFFYSPAWGIGVFFVAES